MNKAAVLAFLDSEIERLQQARQILSANDPSARNGDASGRRRNAGGIRRRRRMSPAARRRISEGQKKRWAARKKAGL